MCCAVALADPTTPGGVSPPCPSKALFGVVCPGCGSARMIYSLVHGDIPAAVAFNAVGVVALVLVGWSYVVWTLRRTRVTDLPRWETWRWSPHIVLAVVLVWAVVRNIPVAPFDSLRV